MEYKYGYSFDGEHFEGEFETRERAVGEAAGYADGREFVYTGKCKKFAPTDIANIIILRLQEDAWDTVEELSEGWLRNPSPESKKELEDFINKWIEKYDKPDFFPVEDVKEHKIIQSL